MNIRKENTFRMANARFMMPIWITFPDHIWPVDGHLVSNLIFESFQSLRGPNIALPTLTVVAPSAMAVS